MAYYVWRSDSPSGAAPFPTIEDAHRALRRAMASCHDRRIKWCLVEAPADGADWQTVICGRHGDLV